mmetsp:Transcript_11424/g.21371  ORF Transcript_11424/g.21371 Transcript_11424/m.21371 type:complete len:495 (-) Transcript_11424:577-2061(-)
MVSNRDIINNVISNIEDSRCRNLFELESEFHDGSRKISELIESWKRRIIDAGSLHGYIMNNMENCHENENRHPNVAIAADSRKDTKGLDVTSMKVSELREHLRIRNLDDKGLKKDLQERLQKDLEEKNVLKSERTSTDAVMIPVTISDEECRTACRFEDVENTADTLPHIIDSATESKGKNKVSDYSGEAGEEAAEMEDDNQNEDVPMESGLDMPNSFIEPSKKSSVISMDTDRENHHYSTQAKEIEPTNDESLPNSKSTKKQNLGKKIMRLFSPSKVKSSTTVESNESSKELSKNENDVSGPYNREKTAHHPSDDIQQPVQNSTDHFAPLTDGPVSQIGIQKDVGEPSMFITDDSLVPNILSHDTKDEEHTLMTPAVPIKVSGKIFSSSTAQAKKKEIDEARKARLEKIRSKVSHRMQAWISHRLYYVCPNNTHGISKPYCRLRRIMNLLQRILNPRALSSRVHPQVVVTIQQKKGRKLLRPKCEKSTLRVNN